MTGGPRRGRFGFPRERKRLYSVLFTLDVALILIFLSLAHATAAGPADRALARSVAILTEVDSYLDVHYAKLQTEAQQTDGPELTLPSFPLGVSFTPSEVNQTNRDQFRALLLARSASLIRRDGMDAFKQDGASGVHSDKPEGALRMALDLLRPAPHRTFTIAWVAFAIGGVTLTLGLASSTEGYGRVTALGISLLVASVPFLLAAVALHYGLRIASHSTEDYLARSFLRLGANEVWAGIRDSAIFSMGGLLLVAYGLLPSRWSEPARERPLPSRHSSGP